MGPSSLFVFSSRRIWLNSETDLYVFQSPYPSIPRTQWNKKVCTPDQTSSNFHSLASLSGQELGKKPPTSFSPSTLVRHGQLLAELRGTLEGKEGKALWEERRHRLGCTVLVFNVKFLHCDKSRILIDGQRYSKNTAGSLTRPILQENPVRIRSCPYIFTLHNLTVVRSSIHIFMNPPLFSAERSWVQYRLTCFAF